MKTIDQDTYLKALALSTMANDLDQRVREMQLKVGEMLGLEDGSHVDDAIYSSERLTVSRFDTALKRAGISPPTDPSARSKESA